MLFSSIYMWLYYKIHFGKEYCSPKLWGKSIFLISVWPPINHFGMSFPIQRIHWWLSEVLFIFLPQNFGRWPTNDTCHSPNVSRVVGTSEVMGILKPYLVLLNSFKLFVLRGSEHAITSSCIHPCPLYPRATWWTFDYLILEWMMQKIWRNVPAVLW